MRFETRFTVTITCEHRYWSCEMIIYQQVNYQLNLTKIVSVTAYSTAAGVAGCQSGHSFC